MTNLFKTLFPNKYTLFVVVHVQSVDQTLQQLSLIVPFVDGVFLIGHGLIYQKLFRVLSIVRNQYPTLWIGINCLDLSANEVFKKISELNITDKIDGVWTDNAGIGENTIQLLETIMESKKDVLYFGGIAFKYQPVVKNLELITRTAMGFMDVITTSGEMTGVPPNVEKIQTMRSVLGSFPLAIASGITPENVHLYHQANCFLVSTGISNGFFTICSDRLKLLSEKILLMNEKKYY